MAKTIEQLKAQGAEVKNATVVGENTATRVGTLFNDIVEHVEDYEAKQAEKDNKQDNDTANLVSAETSRAKAAEEANTQAIAKRGIYDVSAYNGGAVFESLSALLNNANLSTLIPESVRCGGMSIRFIQASDNKYVQFRCMYNTFTTDVSQWQGVDKTPVVDSKNLVESGGVAGIKQSDVNILEEEIKIESNNGEEIVKVNNEGLEAKKLKSGGNDVLCKELTSDNFQEDTIVLTDNNNNVVGTLSKSEQDFKNLKNNGKSVLTNIDKPLEQVVNIVNSKTILYVKKDGTGDFQTPQEAINSIHDASISNQYEIRICDDFESTDLRDLWQVTSPTTKNTSELTPTTFVSMITTKPYVDIVGWNRPRKISIKAPNNITPSSMQYVTALHLTGTCRVENLIFEVKNGRYAIHQEGSFSTLYDKNCTTHLKNVVAIHLGNAESSDPSAWTAICAQANGAASGMTLIYENVTWITTGSVSFYMHGNKNFEAPYKVKLIGCSVNKPYGFYIGTNGSGQKMTVECERCNIPSVEVRLDIFTGNTYEDNCHDIRTLIPHYHGMGNSNSLVNHWDFTKMDENSSYLHVLAFKTTDNNKNVKVVGGTAKALIYGDDLLYYDGTTDQKGFVCGTDVISKRSDAFGMMLANRLGDCSVTNKTLIVEVNDVEQTIVFNENYSYNGTTQTTYTDSYIIGKINEQLTGAECVVNEDKHQICYLFDDCKEYACNTSTDTIMTFMPLKRNNQSAVGIGWRICEEGEMPEAIACERINPHEFGNVAIIDKCSFDRLYGIPESGAGSLTQNKYYKVGSGGTWVLATDETDGVLWCNNNHYLYKV